MKRGLGIRGQFVVAGALLVAVTAASSAWSAWAFHEVGRVVDATVRDSEQTTAATAALATALEREDDALLLTLSDEPRGREALGFERIAVADALGRLTALLTGPGEREMSATLSGDVGAYHRAGDVLIVRPHEAAARLRYHEEVNPLLRRTVADASRIRDQHFRSAQQVASWARDRASRATEILSAVTIAALLVSLLIALYLTRTVVLPIRALTTAAEAMRRGDFDRRVPTAHRDELGRLSEAFNRMAEDLASFRRANVGEVLRAKETLEATLAALPDAVVVIDSDGSIASTNPRAAAYLAAAPDPPRGLDTLPIPERVKTMLEVALLGEHGEVAGAVDLAHAIPVRVGSSIRQLLPRVVPIEGLLDRRRGAVLVLSDVTDLVRLDEMRTELVAVASHELRTPMTTLRMTLIMLEERAASLTSRDRELVATALGGVDQLASTVDEFLDLTRIEAGQLRLNLDRLDVGALVRREATAIRGACEDAGVGLVVEGAREPMPAVRGDAARLQVVVGNLLDNALKYTPSGGRIAVAATATDRDVAITVEDSGPGVRPEFRARVFEKFFRVEHHREGDAGVRGSGIGLYIAREVVDAHGGTIRCEEGAQGGARFVVTLPVFVGDAGRSGDATDQGFAAESTANTGEDAPLGESAGAAR